MATITNTAGNAGMQVLSPLSYGTILFTTPPNPPGQNLIFIAYITVQPGVYNNLQEPTEERKPIKYILGPDTTIRWNNDDQNNNLRVQWSWAQMEIQ